MSFEINYLSIAAVTLLRGAGGALAAVIDGVTYPEVVLHQAFPLSRPGRWLSLRTADGAELGIISDLADLDPESAAAAAAELRLRYLVPRATRIDRISSDPSFWVWEVQTDRGPMRLVMRNLHEHLQALGPGRLLVTDMDGRRCEIAAIDRLDAHSRRQLAKVL